VIQNILGTTIGGLITFLLLLLFDGGTRIVDDRNTSYLIAIIIGGIASILWPIVVGIWLARRAKARRDNRIESEVQRQINEQNRNR
jgi:hypothetical protein